MVYSDTSYFHFQSGILIVAFYGKIYVNCVASLIFEWRGEHILFSG